MSRKTGVLSDESAQGRLREQGKDREALLGAAMKSVVSTADGRMVMHYIIYTLLGLKSVCLMESERLAALTEGRRLAAKLIEELVEKHAPEHAGLMVEEARRLLAANAAQTASAVKEEDDDA